MMNKQLIFEITRIHEMMGIKSNKYKLLVESWREIFGISGREYAINGPKQAFRENWKEGLENLSPNYGPKKSGSFMTVDDMVNLGTRYAREAGEEVVDEAGAIAYFFKEAGQNAMTDYQKLLTKLRTQEMEFAAQALEVNATARGKAALQSWKDDMVEIRRQLDAGEIDLPKLKNNLKNTIDLLNGQKTTDLNRAIKETLTPELEKTVKELDDLDSVLPQAGSKTKTDFITDLDQIEQDAIQSAFEAQQKAYKVDPNLDPTVKTPTVPNVNTVGKETSEKTLETLPKKTEPIGFGNESTITESLSRNSNYQTKLREIYDKMFSFMKDSQKKYLDIIDETERANMENFKKNLIERFEENGITEITVTAKNWMNVVKSGKARPGRPIKMSLEDFEKELENYFLFTTKDNKWSPLNKIDTNYASNSKEFWSIIKTLYPDNAQKMLKEGLTNDNLDEIIKDLETKISNNDPTLRKYLNNWLLDDPLDENGFLSDILKNSKSGKEAEAVANTFADKFSKNVADVSEGNPYDMLLNIDGIRRLTQDTPFGKQGELKTIQTKKVANIKDLGNGRYYVTTAGKLEIPKQGQIDILFLVARDGKTIGMGKQTPYLNPLGEKKFPSAIKTKRGTYGFFVDSDTPKIASF